MTPSTGFHTPGKMPSAAIGLQPLREYARLPPCSAPTPDRQRLPLDFDPGRLAADLAAVAGTAWFTHFVTQNYQGDWSVIPLRRPAGGHPPDLDDLFRPWLHGLRRHPLLAAAPYFRAVLATLACPLLAARLMRLAPGSLIKEHADLDLAFEQGTVLLHIPVTTNEDVDFRLNEFRCPMLAGSTWYLRLSDPHSVANRGDRDRVHMVIDATVNGWLMALFARHGASLPV